MPRFHGPVERVTKGIRDNGLSGGKAMRRKLSTRVRHLVS